MGFKAGAGLTILNELRQRTDDLSEALEQQTATSEVLQVISSSPGELEPVFQAMLQNSVRICQAKFGQMFRYENNGFRYMAQVGAPPALVEWDKLRGVSQPSAGGTLDRLIRTREVVHLADVSSEYASNPAARLGGARSYIAVPMLKEGELIGARPHSWARHTNHDGDLLRELLPGAATVAVLVNPRTPEAEPQLKELQAKARAIGQLLRVLNASSGPEIDAAFAILATQRDAALLVTNDPLFRGRELGCIKGRNLVVSYHYAEGKPERLPDLAAALVRETPDLLLALGGDVAPHAAKATSTIPIVFVSSADPVQLGLAASLARPAGNATGVTLLQDDLASKRLELLKEAVPRVSRVAGN